MALSNDLFKAILSLDAYNRGYDASIDLSIIFGATQIGNATIVTQSASTIGSDARNIGFYALAYNYNGQTIISYRGTDDRDENPQDQLDDSTGWGGGSGTVGAPQANMAFA